MEQPGEDATDGTAAGIEEPAPLTFSQRLIYAFGPILAGMVIDTIDLVTFGPYGLVFGPFAGFGSGYLMATLLGLRGRARVLIAVAAGVYCTMPFTELIPLATMVGAGVRFWQSGKREPPEVASDSDRSE